MAASKQISSSMDVLTLRIRLENEHGEKAPARWSRAQLLSRLVELEGEDIVGGKKVVTLSPLRLAEIEVNKHAKKKSQLVQHVQQKWNIAVTGNETIDQLKVKAMNAALTQLPGHAKDHCGFGQYADRTYAQVLEEDPRYCKWVITTANEGDACLRLRRLATWLQTPEAQETEVEINMKVKAPGKMTQKSASSKGGYEEQETHLETLMKTVETLTKEVKEMKEEKETRRKVRASGEEGTSNEMDP